MADHGNLSGRARTWALRGLGIWDRISPFDNPGEREQDAADYWNDASSPNWRDNSHWRETLDARWTRVGEDHLDLTRTLLRLVEEPPVPVDQAQGPLETRREFGRVVEWGAGGGANAVTFAPHCTQFVAVDVSGSSIAECGRQVAEVCDTPFTGVLVDVEDPEQALTTISEGSCALFVCFYVFELLPSQAYALRILRLAHRLVEDGGCAVIQVKYRTDRASTRSVRRAYRRNLSNMTTFAIDEFWTAATEVGFTPAAVKLVPENELDERYAYFLLTK